MLATPCGPQRGAGRAAVAASADDRQEHRRGDRHPRRVERLRIELLERELDDRIVRAPDDGHQEQEQVNHRCGDRQRFGPDPLRHAWRRRHTAPRAPCPRAGPDRRAAAPAAPGNRQPPARTADSPAGRRARPTFRPVPAAAPAEDQPRRRAARAARTPRASRSRRSFSTPPAGLLNSPSIVRENSHNSATPLRAMPGHRHDRPRLVLTGQSPSTIRPVPTKPFSFGTPTSDNVMSSHDGGDERHRH